MRPFDPGLLTAARPVRGLVIGAATISVLAAVATITQAVLLARVLAEVIAGGARLSDLVNDIVILAAVIAARALLSWVGEELARRGARRSVAVLRIHLLKHVAALGPRWRHRRSGAALLPLLTSGMDSIQVYLAQYLPTLIVAGIVPPAVVVMLLVTDLTSGVIVLVTLPLIPVFMALVGWYTDRETKRKWKELAALTSFFGEVISGIRTLVVYGRTAGQARAVRDMSDRHRRATMATLRVAFLSSMVLELAATLSVALVAVAVGLRLVSGSLTLHVALTALLLAPEAYLPLRTVGTRFHAAADGVRAVDEATSLLDLPVPKSGDRTVDSALAAACDIHLDQVTVDFGDGRRVDGLTLRAAAGRVTALRGDSGVGKTTALAVIAGLLEPDAGRVTITTSGQQWELKDTDLASWRAHIAWCGQQPVMLPGTVRDNLLLGNPRRSDVTDDELWQALEVVVASDFIAELPSGLSTRLGDEGAGLSAGQLQRLGLARVVLRNAPLIVLDEPTASLDASTERCVVDRLAPYLRGRTVLLATHRTVPLEWADAVIDLSGDLRSRGNGGAPVVSAPYGTSGDGDGRSRIAVAPW